MNSSLDSVLANVILAELENFVVTCFMENGFLKFPCRYANDVSVLHKEDQIDRILKAFNWFFKKRFVSCRQIWKWRFTLRRCKNYGW